MAELSPNITAKEPKGLSEKKIQIDAKGLFKALAKVAAHTVSGKIEELAIDVSEALVAIGLETQVEERAFILISRSLSMALFELVDESVRLQVPSENDDFDELADKLEFSISTGEINIDPRFFSHPTELPLLKEIQLLLPKWLEALQVDNSSAEAIADRLPSYFNYALIKEWGKNAKSYQPIIDALNTPFSKSGNQEWAWKAYSSLLDHRIDEGIFDEPFGLRQMYVPLNAFYIEEKEGKEVSKEMAPKGRKHRRVVVSLEKEMEKWLNNPDQQDAIRVISGGPGSGKSSFARIFAAKVSKEPGRKVLFVPLHLIDASKDLVEEVGRFVKDEGVLYQNPLDPESPESNLLIIFDGLDELASQGKAAAETARAFIREVDRTVQRRSSQKLRVLISGRELVVQENESELRRPRQILTLLPFLVSRSVELDSYFVKDEDEYYDQENLLKEDLRQIWWKKYGTLKGKGYEGLPNELMRKDLTEITAQPLLNYLVALAFTRGALNFVEDINLNSIYEDLIAAVHKRGYEKNKFVHIRQMNFEEFTRVLEEIGLASWHGDGRTTTVQAIEKHCRDSGLDNLLDAFQEGAREGVIRLLAAFFFRKYGQPAGGDSRFVFTHKSFGEYLTARRVVRAIERIVRELERRSNNLDEGWTERDALRNWVEICGPSAISKYLHTFLLNEVRLRPNQMDLWQKRFAKLFSYMLQYGMPMEQLQITPFREAVRQSRNAEEALLVALNACARVTGKVSEIKYPDPTAFGAWFKRVQGQRSDETVLAAQCLSYLDLRGTVLISGDFWDTDIRYSNLEGASLREANLSLANLSLANLRGSDLRRVNLSLANLMEANLRGVNLIGATLRETYLSLADLSLADLSLADLSLADLRGSDLSLADLRGSDLWGANLNGANLNEANLNEANLNEANLNEANLNEANLNGANLDGAISLDKAINLPESLTARFLKKRDKQAD